MTVKMAATWEGERWSKPTTSTSLHCAAPLRGSTWCVNLAGLQGGSEEGEVAGCAAAACSASFGTSGAATFPASSSSEAPSARDGTAAGCCKRGGQKSKVRTRLIHAGTAFASRAG
eukprot:CAMPEP_0175710848 /NCGR_PEP_ID=MMETSP0097-20121207/40292_1 /TAXON_ID=311494 /ORGANISM="Alexandrium monilatum, Strain CCMP3105" /LENGTH=115 /DNA_ID=CAMNT_0017018277 /DNA_START=49 /DNA_END=397 /DNA_ORIENTATION=-